MFKKFCEENIREAVVLMVLDIMFNWLRKTTLHSDVVVFMKKCAHA